LQGLASKPIESGTSSTHTYLFAVAVKMEPFDTLAIRTSHSHEHRADRFVFGAAIRSGNAGHGKADIGPRCSLHPTGHGHRAVFTDSAVLFVDDSLDLTDRVIERLKAGGN